MDELLKKYKIEEISQKTSISPTFLQKLLEHKFEKIDKLKFKGFLKILKSEFPDIDFSELEEKANSYYFNNDDTQKTEKQQIVEELGEEEKNYKSYFFVAILIILIGILFYYMKGNKKELKDNNTNLVLPKITKIVEKNDTNITNNNPIITDVEKNTTEENKTKHTKKYINTNLTIEPLKLVWFKVYYLDLNKSKEFLTSHLIDLNVSKKMFIKFGHGMVKLYYNNQTLAPNKKSILRVIIQNGEMNITTKKVGYFR